MAVEFTDKDEQPIANALCVVAAAVQGLGNADPATVEALGDIANAIDRHAEAVRILAEAVTMGLSSVAKSLP